MPPHENNNPLDKLAGNQSDSDKETVQGSPSSLNFSHSPGLSWSSAKMDPFLNKQIGNLLLQKVLGQGGFGRVYLARDLSLDRDVAVKFLWDTVNAHHLSQFKREARAIAALGKHPSIVAIHQYGEYEGHHYLVLEFMPMSASQLLQKHPSGLPVATALRITLECAEALEAAHQQKILHRDIKPANILLEGEEDRAKLTDFGLAQFLNATDQSIEQGVCGSPPYMSPEQACGETVGPRSDVFSLGATLYELLSGRRMYAGDSIYAILAQIQRDERIPLKTRCANLPDDIIAIVDKATAYEPAKRYASAELMAQSLRGALKDLYGCDIQPTVHIPGQPPPARRSRWKTAGLAAAAVLITAAVIIGWSRLSPDSHMTGFSKPAMAAARELMDHGDFAKAEAAYRPYVLDHPEDQQGQYGLGMALSHLGRVQEASTQLDKVKEEPLKHELDASVAYESRAKDAWERIADDAQKAPKAYPKVLLARLALQKGEYDKVTKELANLDAAAFNFNYQYNHALQTLGQAYYALLDYEKAKAAFATLERREGADRAVAQAYLKSITAKMDEGRRKEIRESAQRIRQQMDSAPKTATPQDAWTSRPLTFFILPCEAQNSQYAADSGVAEVLPLLLGERLDQDTPMNVVDREYITEILQEQELSATLGAKTAQLALGQVLGARLILQCQFAKLQNKEMLLCKLNDVETTELIPVKSFELLPGLPVEAVLDEATRSVWQATRQAYPLHARIHRAPSGPQINVGETMGVQVGMQFEIFAPEGESLPPIGLATVAAVSAGNTAAMVLEGVALDKLPTTPEKGWPVRQKPNKGS